MGGAFEEIVQFYVCYVNLDRKMFVIIETTFSNWRHTLNIIFDITISYFILLLHEVHNIKIYSIDQNSEF